MDKNENSTNSNAGNGDNQINIQTPQMTFTEGAGD